MIQTIRALLFPAKCIVCKGLLDIPIQDSHTTYFCERCASGGLEEPQHVYSEGWDQEEGVVVKALFPYTENYRHSIRRWKYNGLRKYAKGYGQLMSFIDIPWQEVDAIIPVPLSKRRYSKRGFNQALDLGSVLSGYKQVPLFDVLTRIRHTKPQSQCTKKERYGNIRGSIGYNSQVIKSMPHDLKKVVLVDDIYTTGSTVRECVRVLKQIQVCNVEQVYILVVSRGMS